MFGPLFLHRLTVTIHERLSSYADFCFGPTGVRNSGWWKESGFTESCCLFVLPFYQGLYWLFVLIFPGTDINKWWKAGDFDPEGPVAVASWRPAERNGTTQVFMCFGWCADLDSTTQKEKALNRKENNINKFWSILLVRYNFLWHHSFTCTKRHGSPEFWAGPLGRQNYPFQTSLMIAALNAESPQLPNLATSKMTRSFVFEGCCHLQVKKMCYFIQNGDLLY